MVVADWASFSRIFSNRFDTYWWFGLEYYTKYGQQWPHEGQEPPEGYVYPSNEGFRMVLVTSLLLSLLRFAVERLVAEPIGKWYELQHTQPGTPAGPNKKLEIFISKHKKPTSVQITAAAVEADMEVRQVEQWVRRKQRELGPSKLNKFREAFWRFCFYMTASCYGLYTIINDDFFYDIKFCWAGFPTETWAIRKGLYNYYLLEASFYLSLMVSQFMDTKRKDFWEMFLHHIVTLSLIGGSYWGGLYRLGVVTMLTHDVADVFLEGAKISVYIKKTACSVVLICSFAVVFFISRLVYAPYTLIYRALIVEAGDAVPQWPAQILYVGFSLILMILHMYWLTFIIRLLWRNVCGNYGAYDSRSDEEDLPSGSEELKKDH